MRAMRGLCFLLLVLGLFFRSGAAFAGWEKVESGQVRLVSAAEAVGSQTVLRLGVHFKLDDGWKIYWRTPGDAGYAPKVDWAGSVNVGPPRMLWPAPKRFEAAGLQNFGYSGEVLLPVDMPLLNPGAAAHLSALVDFLACAKICVPQQVRLTLEAPQGPAIPSASLHDINRFAALVPGSGAAHGLTIQAVEAVGQGDASRLRVIAVADEPFAHPDLFVEPPEIANFGAPHVSLSHGGRMAVLELPVSPGTLTQPLTEANLTLTLVDGPRSMEAARLPVAAEAGPVAGGGGEGGVLLAMLLAALAGGLVLNLMPCVLPVLSIKVLGAMGHGGAERGHVRAAFLASACGIVSSFLLLAAGAVAVKAAGSAVGWGIQFQQPAFLGFMAAVLVLFAANLWGLFEFRLPVALMNVRVGGVPHHTLLGHFLSGAFATLLATPCSAPFLGTALGFALGRGALEIVLIFSALGLGMAAPFLALAVWPGAAQRLPRPGAWMVTVKKALAVALAVTAVWLGGILSTLLREAPAAQTGSAEISWTPFDQSQIAALVAQGKTVFVDVTADWCITCKVNKAATLERGSVAARLNQADVVAMRADWTRPDDGIARYLASFGRYGIPFNVVYGPGAPLGLPLPELLTETQVLAALTQAAKEPKK